MYEKERSGEGEIPSVKDLFELYGSDFTLIFQGDHFHSNLSYPWSIPKSSRHRVYFKKGKIIRYEISQEVSDRFLGKPKYSAKL